MAFSLGGCGVENSENEKSKHWEKLKAENAESSDIEGIIGNTNSTVSDTTSDDNGKADSDNSWEKASTTAYGKYPELVTKLVLANTAPYANDVIKTVVGTWIDMAKQGDFKDIFIDTAEKTYSEQKLKTYRRFYGILLKMSEPRSLERFIIQGNACMAHDARPWLGKIQVPTLIVGGERDYIVGNKAAYEIAENISDCKLKIYEKYGT